MSDDLYDVAIVGAGPAGATAAIVLAQKGRSVALVDRATFPHRVTCASWLNARCVPLLTELGIKDKSLLRCPVRNVTLYRADFSQSTQPAFEHTPGYLIDRAQFDNALVAAAVDQGVNFVQGCAATDLQLKESAVVVDLADGRHLDGRLLMLASGRRAELFERLGLAASAGEAPIWAAQVDTSLAGKTGPKEARIGIILGLDNAGSFGICLFSRDRVSMGIHWVGEETEAIPTLVQLCRQAFQHEVVPVDLSGEARSLPLIRSPASAALDMESHVGKHTLVIGDAGGFISAASNEGIYPAMWSAQIAVEVIERALHSVHSQDELMTFDSTWRMQMADYLRSPHTDIQFLLPLIFTNQSMADRMGAAFFSGENI